MNQILTPDQMESLEDNIKCYVLTDELTSYNKLFEVNHRPDCLIINK